MGAKTMLTARRGDSGHGHRLATGYEHDQEKSQHRCRRFISCRLLAIIKMIIAQIWLSIDDHRRP